MGRGVFATKFIKRGDIIAVERATVAVNLIKYVNDKTKH